LVLYTYLIRRIIINNVIYIIENTLNNKKYVGSSKNFNKRKTQHFSTLKLGTHHNAYLQRAYNKYGKAVFTCYVVEDNVKDLFEREQSWIDELSPEYNIGSVGGGDNLSKHPDKENILARRSKTQLANNALLTEEEKSLKWGKLGESNPNWKGGVSKSYCSCGTSKAITAISCSDCRDRTGVNNPFYGKKHSEETKRKLSEKALGRLPGNAKEVSAEGVLYPSASAAARAYSLTVGAMSYRATSSAKKWEEFFYTIK